MKRRTPSRTLPASPDFFDSLVNGIANMSVTSALAGFATALAVSLAIYVTVISPIVVFPSYYRSDPTGLISGNPLDVVLGDNLATFDGTGLTLACPSGDTDICSQLTTINNQITNINTHLNLTANSTIDASSITFSGNTPFFSGPVATVGAALNDTAMRLYYNVFSFSLTSSRFPALSFPTDQLTVDEDIGRRLRLLETAPAAVNVTSLPAASITYTPANSSNWNPQPTNQQDANDQLAARVKTIELSPAVTPVTSLPAANITYTNGAFFMTNVSNVDNGLNNVVGELLVHDAQLTTLQGQMSTAQSNIATLQGQTAELLAATSRTFYVSATYGNDGTCDATKTKPCATLAKTLQFYPNVTNEFAQNTVLFDNGLYSESSYIAIPPNVVFAGNEIATRLIFSAGAGYHPTAWSYTGTGFVSWLRWGLIRCTGAPCAFSEADVAPATPIFAVHRFYNSTLEAVAPISFTRAANTSSYLRVIMESTVLTTGSLTFQDPTQVDWSISGDIYATIAINYNTSLTYFAGFAVVNMAGMIPHAAVSVNNYVPSLTIDWSILNVVLRGSATLTRNYVSGATINIHGDILSLGSINGGLLSTGAGSGSIEYLTKAPGLGYTPTTSGDWSPAPITAQSALDQLALRVKGIEGTPQQRVVITFTTGTTTSFSIPSNVSLVYISGCGGGSSGIGANPGTGFGGNAGGGVILLPFANTGANFTVIVGLGGASAGTSNAGQLTSIDNGREIVTLNGGQVATGSGGSVDFTSSPASFGPITETIVAGSAGGNSPGTPASFNGFIYGGAGGGQGRIGVNGDMGGYTPMLSARSSGGMQSAGANVNGGGGGSSIFGIGGTGGDGATNSNGGTGGLCAGGGGGGGDGVSAATNGGAGGNGAFEMYYFVA